MFVSLSKVLFLLYAARLLQAHCASRGKSAKRGPPLKFRQCYFDHQSVQPVAEIISERFELRSILTIACVVQRFQYCPYCITACPSPHILTRCASLPTLFSLLGCAL